MSSDDQAFASGEEIATPLAEMAGVNTSTSQPPTGDTSQVDPNLTDPNIDVTSDAYIA